jgi:hypothetical protein
MFSLIPVKNHLQPERLGIANNDLPQNLRLLQQVKKQQTRPPIPILFTSPLQFNSGWWLDLL